MSNHTFHHVMRYVLDVPMCTKAQFDYEVDCIEQKVQSMKHKNTDAYVTYKH